MTIHHYSSTEMVSAPFDFESTVRAHGWVALRPFAWHTSPLSLSRTQCLTSGQVVRLTMEAGGDPGQPLIQIHTKSAAPLSGREQREISRNVRRMLRLDEDFSEFYRLYEELPGWTLQLAPGGGRLLRCPTLFEDIIYTLCTTNINWSGTIRMIDRMVAALGEPFPEQSQWRAFPTAEAIVAAGSDFLKQETGLGYRSDYVWKLARQVNQGSLDLAALEDPAQPIEALYRELRQIKGVGDYAAATILMLLGRYERLAIDSELRNFTAKKYFHGETGTDAQIRATYAPWGRWQYLAYWFDEPA